MAGVIYRKTKMVLNFRDDKPEVYKIAQISFPAVSYKQLVAECSNSCGVNPSQTQAVVTALLDRLVHYMEIGHPVQMGSFGSFKPTFRCKTAKKIEDADASTVTKKVIRFFPGKDFRNMLAEMPVSPAGEALDEEV